MRELSNEFIQFECPIPGLLTLPQLAHDDPSRSFASKQGLRGIFSTNHDVLKKRKLVRNQKSDAAQWTAGYR
jgi:hypothetical protein